MRETEPGARRQLEDEEEVHARYFALVLNEAMKRKPEKSKLQPFTPEMMKVAARIMRDQRYPELEGNEGRLRHTWGNLKHTLEPGPSPDKVQRHEALRETFKYIQDSNRAKHRFISVLLPGYADGLQASLAYELEGKKGRPSARKLEKLFEKRNREWDRIGVGYHRFLQEYWKAREQAVAIVRDETALITDKKERAAVEKLAKQQRLDMLDTSKWPGEFSDSLANFMVRSSALEEEIRAARRARMFHSDEARRITKRVSVHAKPRGGIPQVYKFAEPDTGDPYNTFSAVLTEERKRIKEQLASTAASSDSVMGRLQTVHRAALAATEDYRRNHPGYIPSFTRVYNQAHKRAEFLLVIRDSESGEVMTERTLGDNLLSPGIDEGKAVRNVTTWLGYELRNHDLSHAPELLKKLMEPVEIRNERILLSGKKPHVLQKMMSSSVENYYSDMRSDKQRELAANLEKRLNTLTKRTYLRELRAVEQADLGKTDLPSEGRVAAVCAEVISMKPRGCKVQYDFRTHEIILSDASSWIPGRQRRQEQRISVETYTPESFRSAVEAF